MTCGKRYLALLLCLLLLTGCGGGSTETIPAPPEQTPEERQEEFLAFLEEIHGRRQAVFADQDPPLLDESWTPELMDPDSDFTQEEQEALLQILDPLDPTPELREAASVTVEEARSDVDLAFRLLRHSYGAYDYFGGDEVFLPLKEAALAALPDEGTVSPEELEKTLVDALGPVLVDGHFSVGGTSFASLHAQYMYYVPDLYFDDPEGLDPDLVKPTIDEEGRLRLTLAATFTPEAAESLLPETATIQGIDVALSWKPDGTAGSRGEDIFKETTFLNGVPLLTSTRMMADNEQQQEQLERLATCGGEYADAPVLVLDLRGNSGGSDSYFSRWVLDYVGADQPPEFRGVASWKLSGLNLRLYETYFTVNLPDTPQWMTVLSGAGRMAQRQGLTLVLQDKGTGSSGENAVQIMHTVENTLTIGGCTTGACLTPNVFSFYLPHSGVTVRFGTGLGLYEDMTNRDGKGWLPDLWVPSGQAQERARKMIEYYGLTELFAG